VNCLSVDLRILEKRLEQTLYDIEDVIRTSKVHAGGSPSFSVAIPDTIVTSYEQLSALGPGNAVGVRRLAAELKQLDVMLSRLESEAFDQGRLTGVRNALERIILMAKAITL